MWLKNTRGKKDAMLTFAAVSFAVVTLNILLATIGTLTIGAFSVGFVYMDSAVMGVYLGATFTAYVSRRWTDKKQGDPNSDPDDATDLLSQKLNS